MATCFIFAQSLSEEQCLCLRFADNGEVDAPLNFRAISETRALQQNAYTVVVLPTYFSSLHELELPWLQESKARAAIPYALEEDLAQNVMTLHFAFDRQHYRHHRYLIVVTDKQTLLDLMARLDALALDFDCVTLDWFALKENEVCVTDNGLLIYDKSFKGALSGELSTLYLSEREPNVSIMTFKDTNDEPPLNTELIDTPSAMWIAKRLLAADRMNLCQGDLKHDNRQQSNQLWYRLCAGTALVMLVSVLLFKLVYLHALTTKTTDIDKKIAVIYHRFFPEAKQVISPKFRMGQLLSVDASRNEAFVFWVLLDKLARSFKDGSSIQQLNFQNQVLSVTMVSQNFAALEKLQQQLQQLNVKVTQAQAASDEGKVKAILELSL